MPSTPDAAMKTEDMEIPERLAHFELLFGRLKRNRELLSLRELQTTYAEAYGELVAELTADADWWADAFIECMAVPYPPDPKDEAGNAWMRQTIRRISQEERAPGGLREKYLKALIDDLDRNGFEDYVVQWRDRILAEAFEPYCQKHNRWIGTPGNRWIYNDILRKYWLPDRTGIGGRWIGPDRSGQEWRFAPRIGPDPDAGAAA